MKTPVQPNAPTSTAAVLSLVFGIVSWLILPLLGALVAIVCGHVARADIRRAQGALGGDALALTGLILGWAQLALLVLIFVFWLGVIVLFGTTAVLFGG